MGVKKCLKCYYYTILNNVEWTVGCVYADVCLYRGQIKRVLERILEDCATTNRQLSSCQIRPFEFLKKILYHLAFLY